MKVTVRSERATAQLPQHITPTKQYVTTAATTTASAATTATATTLTTQTTDNNNNDADNKRGTDPSTIVQAYYRRAVFVPVHLDGSVGPKETVGEEQANLRYVLATRNNDGHDHVSAGIVVHLRKGDLRCNRAISITVSIVGIVIIVVVFIDITIIVSVNAISISNIVMSISDVVIVSSTIVIRTSS